MRVEKLKGERQRQIGNVQKQLLNNYFLEKYSTLMTKLSKSPQKQASVMVAPRHQNNKINFKNMILQKKNENNNSRVTNEVIGNVTSRNQKEYRQYERSHEKIRSGQNNNESNTTRTVKKLQDSIINELYRPSPSKLETGYYNRLQIHPFRYNDSNRKSDKGEFNQNEVINITYDENEEIQNEIDQEEKEESNQKNSQIASVREAMRRQFSQRKQKSISPKKKSCDKIEESEAKSSNVSVQNAIQSPKALNNIINSNSIKRKKSQNQTNKEINLYSISNKGNESSKKDNKLQYEQSKRVSPFISQDSKNTNSPKVYFMKQMVEPIEHKQDQSGPQTESIVHDHQIEFLPPTSNYYQSRNPNFLQDTFKHQEKGQLSQHDSFSQKQFSHISGDKKQVASNIDRIDSNNSFKNKSKNVSEGKDSSQLQMSFVSKLSMMSTDEGINFKSTIEKQLFENELGPYQSALYSVLQLIQKYPRSGPVYAIGQRTMQDRKNIQYRKRDQKEQIQEYNKKIDRLRKKSQIFNIKGSQDVVIKRNKLQIMRLIRQISTKL